jgi:hypothetical protein
MAASKVLIHAGLAKTGTTSIQAMLYASRRALADQGISVWRMKRGAHSRPLTTAFGKPEARKSVKAYPGDPAEIRASLASAIAASHPTFVLSAEAVSHFALDELESLVGLVRESGAEAKAIVYVRRADRHAVSLVQQVLRDGRTLADAMVRTDTMSYRDRIGPLFEAFGKDNVDVRLCPEPGADPDALLLDFLGVIGARPAFALERFRSRNTSLSHRAALLLSAINDAARSSPARRSYRWLVPLLREKLPGPPFRLPADALAAILDRHQDDIRWLREQTGHDLSAPDPAPGEPAVSLETDQALAPLLLSLVEQIVDLNAALELRGRGDQHAS